MANEAKHSIGKHRFIPYRKQDVIQLCLDQGGLDSQSHQSFRQLCHILESLIHFEFHATLETLKNSYAPFDPNADTLVTRKPSKAEQVELQQQFADTFKTVLNAANYEQVTDQDLEDALHEESLFKVNLQVEFDDFEQVVFYHRGEHHKQSVIKTWGGLKKETLNYTNYDRVAVFIKFKNVEYFASKERKDLNFTPGSTIIKLFQDVPKADLEMLFPNSEVCMRKIDKLIIGTSAVVGGAFLLVTKLGASILLIAALIAYWMGIRVEDVPITRSQILGLGAGLGLIGAFIYKEWNKFKNRKIAFMKALADNLYFKNLDNNAGVFHHLVDTAEEEEFKEAILGYYFLLTSPQLMSESELDTAVEQWFSKTHKVELDFEVDDALQKLLRMGLVIKVDDRYQALSLDEAKKGLDKHWDGLFDYHQ
jgi:hypothetical protein